MENVLNISDQAADVQAGQAEGRKLHKKGARDAMEGFMHLLFLLCGIVAVAFVLCISV